MILLTCWHSTSVSPVGVRLPSLQGYVEQEERCDPPEFKGVSLHVQKCIDQRPGF